ncbi:MAG: methyl-accepting chemotaxis protein [Xenococcaceae cyanobacterium]
MLDNLKLKGRILAGYSVPIAISIIGAGIVFAGVNNNRGEVELLETKHTILEQAKTAKSGLDDMIKASRVYMLVKTEQPKIIFQGGKEDFAKATEELKKVVVDEQQKENLARIIELGAETEAHYGRLMSIVDAGKANDAIAIERKGDGLKIVKELDAVITDIQKRAEEVLTMQRGKVHNSLALLVTIVIASALVAAILSVIISFLLSGSLGKQVGEAIGMVASSSTEIAATVAQQERTISQQATSVNETTTTVEQMGASSRQAAEQAEASASGARQALSLAENGSQAVQQTMEGMSVLKDQVRAIAEQIMRLSEQTGQIAGISDSVGDLANQTNMLALNAAVEAARAGEHGKGFAVVAGEIRKLADESKKSAEKIHSLVTEVQASMNSTVMVTDEGTKKADESIRLAQGTAETFVGVADAVNNVFLNSQQISLSSKQQVVGVQQVVAAMNALNLGAQETASGITQVKVSTEQLQKAATGLKALV